MNFYNDNVIKLDYNPVLNSQVDHLNAVGATDSVTLRTLDFSPSDATTIFVSKSGNDTGAGTQASPYLTVKHAAGMITETKQNIIIMDDGVYEEESITFSVNCKNIAAALGHKPTVKPNLVTGSSNFLINTLKNKASIASSGGQYGKTPRVVGLSDGNFAIVYTKYEGGSTFYLCYQIIDNNGVVVKAETVLLTSSNNADLQFPDICSMGNNFVIAVHTTYFYAVYYWVFDNSGVITYSSSFSTSSYLTSQSLAITPVGNYNDRFSIIMNLQGPANVNKTYCTVYSITGTEILSPQLLSAYSLSVGIRGCGAVRNPNGGFVLFFNTYNTAICRWLVVNDSGSVLYSGEFASSINWVSGIVNLESNSVLFACSDTSNNVKFVEYSLVDYTIIKALATVYTPNDSTLITVSKISNDNYVVSSGAANGSLYFINKEWSVLASESISAALCGIHSAYCKKSNSVFVVYPDVSSPYSLYQYIKGGLLTDWWTLYSDITFNGINFNNEEQFIWKYMYSSGGNLKYKWSTFENINRPNYKDSDKYPLHLCEAVVSSAEVLNCKCFNNDAGFKITSNSVLVQWSQFFKQQINPAIKVIGAGPNIVINHNDFLYNYICVDLEDNNGSEIIKNNIFYTSLFYAIKAETAVTYSNSVVNSDSYNANAGSLVIRSNPHYINDGYISLENMDLTLKSRDIGYKFDSPALLIGDDTKNAGSVDLSLGDGSLNWTSITVQKDLNGGIELYEDPVGGVETIYNDGSVDTFCSGFTEVLTLKWRVSILSDFIKLYNLYHCGKNTVRIYLDPATSPEVYGTYILVFDKINKFSRMPKLSRTGIEDVSLTFKRAHNEGL